MITARNGRMPRSEDDRGFQGAKAMYTFEDGDLLIRCMPDPSSHTFLVHRDRLAGVSTFFRDLEQPPTAENTTKGNPPEVTLQATWQVGSCLLGCAYNSSEVLEALRLASRYTLLDVFCASSKYGFASMKALSASLLCCPADLYAGISL
ncbi:hypothetical protein P389DRAFT_11826 [Cystobasidium minutum MCA 4210]|uniref:uncharacterized protein n=1 Tax=Cystobasidium minutum MCA 4210 TaxID=1397322 RepID=UPI0034CE7782|eukprot:jgi/Rhomi1/11826/CE11825_579